MDEESLSIRSCPILIGSFCSACYLCHTFTLSLGRMPASSAHHTGTKLGTAAIPSKKSELKEYEVGASEAFK